MGNCLCVLGDSMAMPIGSMLNLFRDEFEEHIERARSSATSRTWAWRYRRPEPPEPWPARRRS